MSAITTIAQGQVAQRFLSLEPQLRFLKKSITEGISIPVGTRGQAGAPNSSVSLTATQVSEAIGEDGIKIIAAIDAALAVFDAPSDPAA